jgi:competence protein ComEA
MLNLVQHPKRSKPDETLTQVQGDRPGFFARALKPTLEFFRFLSLRQQYVLLLLALLLLSLSYFRLEHPPPISGEKVHEVVGEVSGEVLYPGIHLFQKSPTLKEVLEKAGAFKEASPPPGSSLERLETGTNVTVIKGNPDEIRVRLGRMEARKLIVFSLPLDLNWASSEDLCLVPGIGESLAGEIIAFRQRRNVFRSVEEIRGVRGIGEKKYESLKPYLTVRPSRPGSGKERPVIE